MDMRVESAGGHDQVLSGDDFSCGADDEIGIDTSHGVRIAGLSHFDDAAVADADIAFHDSPMIDDQSVGDDEIECAADAFARRGTALAHAVADHFTAAESDFVAISGIVTLDFDD